MKTYKETDTKTGKFAFYSRYMK